MKSFLVGLLVLFLLFAFSILGVLLFPLLQLLGVLLRWLVGVALLLLGIWLIGKITLVCLDAISKREKR
jgi:hypothetical protein